MSPGGPVWFSAGPGRTGRDGRTPRALGLAGGPAQPLREAPRPQQQGRRVSRSPCRAALNPESVSTQLCPSPTGCTASSWLLLWRVGLPGKGVLPRALASLPSEAAGRPPCGGWGHVTTDFLVPPPAASPAQRGHPFVTELWVKTDAPASVYCDAIPPRHCPARGGPVVGHSLQAGLKIMI